METANTEACPSTHSLTPWWMGNARLINFSGQLLGAHLAHAGLIMFWAGSTTIAEVSHFDPKQAISAQQLVVIPHLATLGFGLGAGKTGIDPYPYFVIGVLHLVSSAVLAAGGLYHIFGGASILSQAGAQARKFHYEWDDPQKLGFILGQHLIVLGIAAWLFVLKAVFFGGIYDSLSNSVHRVNHPTLDPGIIFGYIIGRNHGVWNPLGLASVNTLEDIVGGHFWIGLLEILGGIWHIRKPPAPWARWLLLISADAILSYSLAGIAWMAFLSCFFVYNPIAFPPEFYGSDPASLATVQFLLGLLALGGHIWHASLARAQARARTKRWIQLLSYQDTGG